MMWITPNGSGVSPDSTIYIEGAKSLLSGKGFFQNGDPIIHFPPLYPIFLAIVGLFENNLVDASRLLNAIIFGLSAGIIALAINLATKRNFVASICAVCFFVSSAPLLEVHAWAWSEPLFIALSLACILLLSMYMIEPTTPLLVASALFLGFTLITRYIGIAFLPAALVIILIGGRDQDIKQRFKNVFLWFLLTFSPLGIWFVRNLLVAGAFTDRQFAFHPISIYEYGKNFISIIINFFAPTSLPLRVTLSLFGLFAILLIIFVIMLYKRHQLPTNWYRLDIAMTASCLLFFLSYTLFLFLSISFFDASTPVNNRLLSPILAILILAFFSTMWTISQTFQKPFARWSLFLLIILSISLKTPEAIHSAVTIAKGGLGYTARRWQESKTIAFTRSLIHNVDIYSNGADVIRFLTEKSAQPIPKKTDPVTMVNNFNFDEEMRIMCKNIVENNALLVYFDNIIWRWYFPSQTEIETTCHPPVLQQLKDGIVYGK